MNKVYKVIWSRLKGTYVVVSELAKSHGKNKSCHDGAGSRRAWVRVLVLSCLIGGTAFTGVLPAGADYVTAGTTTNVNNNTLAVGGNTTASGAGALTVGGGSSSSGTRAIAIAGGEASSDYTIAMGENAKAGGSYTYSRESTSGLSGTATNAIAIGHGTTAKGVNDVVIGANETAETPTNAFAETNADGTGGTAVGGRILVGHDNKATGRAGNSVIVGSNNVSNAAHGIAIGQNSMAGMPVGKKTADGKSDLAYENSMAIGVNTRSYATSTIAIGNNAVAGNINETQTATDSNGRGAIALGENAQSTSYYTVAIGGNSAASSKFSVSIGEESGATGANTLALGYGAKATDVDGIALGQSASASGQDTIAQGYKASASSTGSIALGKNSISSGFASIVLGAEAQGKNSQSVAIGYNAHSEADKAIALGNATAKAEGSVALGYGSTATRAAETNSAGWKAMDSTWSSWLSAKDSSISTSSSTWNSTLGVVSIGTDAASTDTGTRQLTGVAAGVYDTDAVNMAQWKNTMLATVGDLKSDSMTTTYGTDGKARTATKLLNESLTITGAGDTARSDASDTTVKTLAKSDLTSEANIGTIVSDNQIDIRLAKNLEGLESASFKNSTTNNSTKVTGDGITITTSSGDKVSLTQEGLNNGNQQITNVKSGGDTAANGANIADVTRVSQKNIQVAGGSNITVTDSTSGDVRTSTVALNNNIDLTKDGSIAFGSTTENTYIDKTGVNTHTSNTDGTRVDATLSGAGLHVTGKDSSGNTTNQVVTDESGMVVGYEDGDKANTLFDSEVGTGKQKTSISTKGVKVEGSTTLDTSGKEAGTSRKINTTLSEEGVNINQSQTLLQERGLTVGKDSEKTTAGQATVYRTGLNVTGSAVNDTAGKTTTVTANGLTANDDTAGDKIATVTSEGMTVQADKDQKKTATYDVSGVTIKDTDSSKTNTVSVDGMNIQNGTSSASLTTTNLQLGMTSGTGGINLGNQAGGGANTATGNYLTGLSNTAWDANNIASGRAATEDQLQAVDKKASQHTAVTVEGGKAAGTGTTYTGTNLKLNATTDTNGKVTYDLKLADSITLGTGTKSVTIDGTTGKITAGTDTSKNIVLDGNSGIAKIGEEVRFDGTAGKSYVGGATLGKQSAGALTFKDKDGNTVTGTQVPGGTYLTGLTNTSWSVSDPNYVSGRAATEDELLVVSNAVKDASTKASQHTAVTVEGGKAAGTGTTYTGTNLKLNATTDTDGKTTYDLKLSDTLSIGGSDGTNGQIGINGSDGKSGVTIDGTDGISIKGSDGNTGVTIKGVDGTNGTEGHIGLKGEDGITDIWTAPGTPGLSGKDGETMTRIVYKDQDGNKHEGATLDDGLKFSGDFGTASAVKLNKTVNIKGNAAGESDLTDGNIGVVSSQDGDNGQLLIKLNKDLNLTANGSVTIGNITLKTGNVSMGGNQITGVASGNDGTTYDTTVAGQENWNNAANIGDVKTAINQISDKTTGGFGLKADDNNTVTQDLGKTITVAGGSNITTSVSGDKLVVSLKDKVDLGKNGSVTTGNTTIDNSGVSTDKIKINNSQISISGSGINAGDTTITNVKSGIVNGDDSDNSNGANIGDVKTIAQNAADAVKAKGGKNITVDTDGTVNLNDKITMGDATDKSRQVSIDGNGASITAGDGENKVTVDGSNGQVIAGGATLGKQAGGGANTDTGSYLTGLDNTKWDSSTFTSGRAATEDQLKAVDDKISGGRVFEGDDGSANQVTVGLGSTMKITGGADASNLADGNIGVVKNSAGDGLEIKLSRNIKGLDSVTTGNTSITDSGLTVKTGDSTHNNITIQQGNVNMGGNVVSGVSDGKVAPGSTEAVNGGQLAQRDAAINSIGGAVNKLGTRVNRVGAGAAALSALHPLDFDPDDKWDVAAGYGNYKDANAVAVGAFYRPNEDTMFSVGGSFGGGENMVNAGVSVKLGQGNHVSTSRVAMAKEIKDLRKEVEELRSALVDVAAGKTLDPMKTKLFPDTAKNHWAYHEVSVLGGNGILEGYPDGTFGGDRMMTRYEFAMIVYRQMQRGAELSDRLLNEFEPELERIRVDTIAKDKNGKPTIQRVRVIKGRE